jgi:hypothetical protein
MYHDGARVFIEAGPGRVLGNLIDGILNERPHKTMHLDVDGRPGWEQLAHLLAQATAIGLPVNLNRWFEGRYLREIEVKDVVEETYSKIKPGPMVFRLNGAKSRPWNARPGDIGEMPKPTDGVGAKTESLDHIVHQAQGQTMESKVEKAQNQSQHNRRKRMAPKDDFVQNTDKQQRMLNGRVPSSVHSQVQENISEYLKLQRGQLEVLQRFLDIQERLLNGQKHGDLRTFNTQVSQANTDKLEHETNVEQTKIQAKTAQSIFERTDVPLQTQNVPPAPALPKLEIISSTEAIASRSAIKDKVNVSLNTEESGPIQAAPTFETGGVEGPATVEQFKGDLLRLVSARTGYPEDMLDLDVDMEAELGIDSIKRIEIFNDLRDHHDLLEGKDEETVLKELTDLKTLNRIVDWYSSNLSRALEAESGGLKKA